MAKIKNKNREMVYNKILSYKKLRGAWKKCIDEAITEFEGTEKMRLFELIINGRAMVPICMELYISQRTYFSWRDDIINAVLLHAAYNKLIEP